MAMFASLLPMIGSLLGGLGGGGDEKKGGGAPAAPSTAAPSTQGPTLMGGNSDLSATGLAALAGTLAGTAAGNPAAALTGQTLATTLSGHPIVTNPSVSHPITHAMTPSQSAAFVQNAHNTLAAPQQQHLAQVGRAQVNRTVDAINPHLSQIHGLLTQRANQVQATAEHRNIAARQKFEADVEKKLDSIQRILRHHHRRTMLLRTY